MALNFATIKYLLAIFKPTMTLNVSLIVSITVLTLSFSFSARYSEFVSWDMKHNLFRIDTVNF